MKDVKNRPQGTKDIFNQIQDKASRVVDLAKWKLDQQSRLSKLGNEIRALETEIEAKKTFLADTILTLHAQGKTGEEEIEGVCIQIEQLDTAKNIKMKEKSDVEVQQPPQAHHNDDLLPALIPPKLNDELRTLLSEAESALQGGDRGRAATLINQALQIDYTYPAIWVLLQQSLGSQQSPNDFQLEFTKKYFPGKLELLTTPIPVAQQPFDDESNYERPVVLQESTQIQQKSLEQAETDVHLAYQPVTLEDTTPKHSSPTSPHKENVDLLNSMDVEQIDKNERAPKIKPRDSRNLKVLAWQRENQSNISSVRKSADDSICETLGVPSEMLILKYEKVLIKTNRSALAGVALGTALSILSLAQGADIDFVAGKLFFPVTLFFSYLFWSASWTTSDDVLVTSWYFQQFLSPLVAIFVAIEHNANLKHLKEQRRIYEEGFKDLLYLPDNPPPVKDLPLFQKIRSAPGISAGLAVFLMLMKGVFLIAAVIAIIALVIFIIMENS